MTIPHTGINDVYIDGEWRPTVEGIKAPIINPATEQVIAQAPVATAKDAELAIAAARNAFDSGPWAKLSMRERADKVEQLHDEIWSNAGEIVELIIAETGCPRMTAETAQFRMPLGQVEWAIGYARRMEPVQAAGPLEPAVSFLTGQSMMGGGVIVREAKGVVACITPYNYPFYLNLVKIVPALLMGNSVILKPSPFTPFCALALARLVDRVGFPAGTVNVIPADIPASELATSDPRVDMVTFTGSETVGAQVMRQAAPTIKDVHLELGGKSAMIVREDADVRQAAVMGAAAISTHAGQGCACLTRHIVHNAIRERYVQAVAGVLESVKAGDPTDPATNFGPLIRESARERSEMYVQLGLDGGGRLAAGGKRPEGLDRGYYYEPTIIDNVDNSSRIAQEEIFGPVAVVIGYDADEEAIAMANDSNYGLYGGIFSSDVAKAYDMALQMRTGSVLLNGGSGSASGYMPFGGYKRSGIGRECGPGWLEEFSEVKSIMYHIA
ncbi:MAG: aldehyde dehydrogenase family protein [Gammaproteobacteria bacterium]|nr:aldehyde dehydrogenase family protein [Gammaproteobacteria bacterium]